jgi:GTP-binding protein
MLIKSAEFAKSAQSADDYPKDGLPHIAVAGRSNVGKSSLLNMLVQRKSLVKTSQMPGKTRLINFFLINKAFYLVDIPGFGYAKVGREEKRHMEEAIEDYFKASKSVAGMMYLVDIRMTDSPVDREAIEWLNDFGVPMLIVATKGDKLNKQESRKAAAEIARIHNLPEPPLITSADKKTGRDEVLEQLAMVLETAAPGSSGTKT